MSADEICAKGEISRAKLREWKKLGRFEYLSGDLRELVIAALASGKKATLERLAAWADYQDHSPYSEAEIRVVVDGLERRSVRFHSHSDRLAAGRRTRPGGFEMWGSTERRWNDLLSWPSARVALARSFDGNTALLAA